MYQTEKNTVPLNLNAWKDRGPRVNYNEISENIRSKRSLPTIEEIYPDTKTSDPPPIIQYPDSDNVVAQRSYGSLSVPYEQEKSVEQPQHNTLMVAIKAIIRKIGFLALPGLLLFIVLNDSQVTLVRKLGTFCLFFIYSVIVVVNDGLGSITSQS